MKDFNKFVEQHKDVLFEFAEKNTKYDSAGRAVITKDDICFYEDDWDKYYEELVGSEKNLTARSLVRRVSI